MALTKITKSGITDSAVDNNKIEADAVDATKIADNAISEEHLDATVISDTTLLNEGAQSDDVALIFDTSSGTLKKISVTNFLAAPSISSISPTTVQEGDGTGNYTFTITGSNFQTGIAANLVNTSGTDVNFDSVTRDSTTQLTCVIAKSSLPNSGEPYDVKITSSSGLNAQLLDQINVNASPAFVTAAGLLSTIQDTERSSVRIEVVAQDPESAGDVTFELQSGSLPAGLSLSNEGGSGRTVLISGTATRVGSDTTSNFVLRSVDAASNTSSRAYSILVAAPKVETFTSSGTFSVPSGVTSVDVLVVAGGGAGVDQHGGGGGAGGLIFMPGYPVTPGGTVSVTVGCGGQGQAAPISDSQATPVAMIGQDSVFGTLTAKGGGNGGNYSNINDARIYGRPGGSGGGGGMYSSVGIVGPGGPASQPTQPGNSGAYGFGNAGAPGGYYCGNYLGGGGGGAGAAGNIASPPLTIFTRAGQGGIGRAYTIADGTTPVYYAGGGGGGRHDTPSYASDPTSGAGGDGGQGGGGNGNTGPRAGCGPSPVVEGQPGQANKGGGGGSGGNHSNSPCNPSPSGGKGVVIVRWT